MLKFNAYPKLLKNLICRFLFLLLISVFAIYPVLDACADSFNSSIVLNDMDDDGGDDHDAVQHAAQDCHAACIALFHQASAAYAPVLCLIDRTKPAIVVRTSQACPPLSSDPSPPVV